ncbi:unnamed protein product [Oreochromis niloticus]|nr:unnamed protein product [Mustela putorius furo]CAI5695872.1 unnamed protein product [Mustela putorius furo]
MFSMPYYNYDIPQVVSPDELFPIINNAFNKLSDVQWLLIENGRLDSDLQAVLADMISEIIQLATTNVLRLALPAIQRGAFTDFEKKISLGNSISATFAKALNIPEQYCVSAEELTKMVEREILDKVQSIATLVRESSNLPPDPAVYVSGTIPNISKLRVMVFLAGSSLKLHAKKRQRALIKTEGDSYQFEYSSDSSVSGISRESATSELSDILAKYSQELYSTDDEFLYDDEDTETEPPAKIEQLSEKKLSSESGESAEAERQAESMDPETTLEKFASDIDNIIFHIFSSSDTFDTSDTDSSSHSEKCISPKSGFNVRAIFDKVRKFFTSRAPCAPEKSRKHHFSKFAQKHYEKMKEGLKNTVKESKKHFISLLNITHSPETERMGSHDNSVSLQGSTSENPHPKSTMSVCAPSRSSSTLKTMVKCSTPTNFNVIRSEISDIYNKFTKQEEHYIIQKTLENIRISENIKNFSRELTEKVYDHLMISRIYQIPTTFMGRSLSDSVISRTPQRVAESRVSFPPEVLYVIIEDAVAKFLQKILLLVDDENIDEIIQCEKASEAIKNIQNFIATAQTQAKDTESDSSQKSGRESRTPCHSRPASPERQAKSPEKTSTSSRLSLTPVLEKWEEELPEKSVAKFSKKDEAKMSEQYDDKFSKKHEAIPSEKSEEKPSTDEKLSEKSEDRFSEDKPSENVEKKLSEVSVSSAEVEEVSQNLVYFVLIRLLEKSKSRRKGHLTPPDGVTLADIIERLKNLVAPEISSAESITRLENDVRGLTKKLVKGLIKEFGSPEKIMDAALACDSSFDEAILRLLKIHLGVPTSSRQKSRVARFFSALKKALMKPFRCCFKGSDD